MLTKVEWFAHSADDWWMSQFRWTFTDMFPAVGTTPATVVTTQGTLPNTNYEPRGSLTFTQKVNKVQVCDDNYDINNPNQFRGKDLKFYYASGSADMNGWSSCDHVMTLVANPFVGAIRGFHWRRAYSTGNLKYYDDARYWSVFLDDDPCSMAELQLSASSMSIKNDGIQTATQDLSSQKTNSIGNSCETGSGYVFAAYNSPAYSWLTVSANGLITVGPTTNPAHIGTHTVNVVMDLYPYARAKASFIVTISCLFDAPQSDTTTFTYTIPGTGSLTTPVNIFSFTQTAASQNCSIMAQSTFVITQVSGAGSLSATNCYPTSNTITGGNVTLNNLTTSNNLGTFSVKIQNKNAENVIKEFTFTLIINQWTCVNAIFETSPSPFSDIVINMPTTNYNIPFKVYTDLERSQSLVCPIIATFITSYAAVSVASPYSNINVTPSSILIPSEYGIHPVRVQIKSADYDQANVARVYFDFNIDVRCTITSFAISTTQTDFHFELESGTPTPKGPYNAVQTPNCQYPVTYFVEWYIDHVLQMSDANSQFDFAQTKYTAITNYSDPLLVGKVIKYNLVYQITDVFGTMHQAEKALLMTIDPNCKLSVLQDRTWDTLIIKVPAPGYPQSSFIDASLFDTTATFFNIPSKCGDRLLSAWSPALPSYVSYDGASQKLSTNANAATLADVGAPQTYSVTCDLQDYVGFATGLEKFDVVIQVICEVFAIQWNTTPPAIIEVVPGITTQPVLVPFASTALPACVDTVYTLASPPSFVSLDSITQIPTPGGNIKIDGALATNHNDYPLVLTATTGTKVSIQTFIVRISDPCSKQVFDSSTLSDMTLIRNFDPAKTQTFSVSYSTLGSNPPIVCPFSCSITNPAGGRPFIIQDAVNQFKITADPALTTSSDAGDNQSDMTCVSVNFPSLVTPKVFQFKTIVSECQANVSLPLITSPTYKVNTGVKELTLSPATLDNSCTYATTYTITSPSSLPSWITWDATIQKFTFNPTIPAHVGSVSIVVKASIPDPATSPTATKTSQQTFTVVVENDCDLTSLIDKTITDMTAKVSLTGGVFDGKANQDVTFLNERSVFFNTPSYCGDLLFTFSPTLPSYLSLDTVGGVSELTLKTFSVADVGDHPFTFTVTLASYSGIVTALTKSFTCHILCEVKQLTFTPAPANIFIEPSVTSQPVTVSFGTTQNPLCGNSVVFSYITTPPAFVSMTGLTSFQGSTIANGALLSDKGIYPMTLQATVDAQTITAIFNVEVSDPCKRAVFEPATNPALASMILIRDFDSQITQSFFVQTDIEKVYGPVCNYVATLTPTWNYVSISGSTASYTITVDENLTVGTDVGIHSIAITVNSIEYSSTVTPKTYTFSLDIQHCLVNTMVFPQLNPDVSQMINDIPLTGFFQPVQWSNLACQYPVTYLYSLAMVGVGPVPWPSWIAANSVALSLTYNPTLPSAVGFYTLTITAQIPQPSVPGGIKEISTSFQLEVIHDCVNTVLQTTTIPDVFYRIATATANQSFWAEDSKAIGQNNQLYCGNRKYVLSPAHSFLTILGDDIHLYSVDPADEGEYLVTITISLVDFPLVPSINVQFKAIIKCEVFSIDVIIQLPPFTPYEIWIDPHLFMPFKVSESPKCGLKYAVSPANDFAFYNATLGQVEVFSTNSNDEGDYDLKLIVSPLRFGVSAELPFSVKMVNKCGKASIIPQKIPNIFAFKQDPSFVAQTSFEFQDFTYDMWVIYKADCGPVNYKLVMNASTKPVPSYVTLKDKKVDVNFNQMPGPGTINLGLFAYLEDFPFRNVTIPFTIELSSSELQCLQATEQKYKFGDPPLNFAVNYQNTTINTGIVLTTVKTPIAIDSRGGEADLPSFVKYDPTTGFFTVKNAGFADFQNYKIGIKIGYKEFPTMALSCTTQLTVGYNPSFTEIGGEMLKTHDINCGQSWSTIIPEYKDAFGYKVEPVVDLGKLEDYLLYISAQRNITTAEDVETIPKGDYDIKINLVDQLGYAAQKKFKIHSICLSFLNGAQAASEKYTVRPPKDKVQNNPPKPFIKSINSIGQVRVGFTQKIQMPTYTKYPEFKDDKNRMKQNCTMSYANPDQCYTRRLLLKQSIEEQTKEAVEIVNHGLVFSEEKVAWEPIIDLQMEPGYYSTRTDLDFVWNCTDFQPTYMDFQINYNHFMNVSIHDFKDSLKIQFNGYWYFQSAENNEIIEESVAIIEKAVPLQMDPTGSATLQAAAATVKAASKSVVIANFAVNLFIGGALQQLFSAIRKLTIMVHLLIINVSIPANAQFFFAGLLSFVTFDIIELGPYIRSGLNLPDEPVLINDNFGYLGYSSGYFVINMGTLVIAIVYFVLMLFFYVVTMCVKNEKFNRFRNWLTKGLLWNSIISFIVESYMLISISSVTNFKKLEFKSVGTYVSSNLAMIGFVILVGYPLWSLFFMKTKYYQLHTPKVKNKFGVVYEDLYLKRRRKGPMTEPLVNLYRMLLLTFVLIFLQKYRYFQLFFVNMSVTFMVIYIGWCEPYSEKKTWNFQFFNESFIAITNYHLMCFADFILDEPTRNVMGWSMIICVAFNLAINIGSIMIDVGKDTYKSLKKKYLLYKLKKAKLAAEARQAEKQIKLQQEIEQNARLQFEQENQPEVLNGGIDKIKLRGIVEAKFKLDPKNSYSVENSLTDMQLLAAEIDAQFDKPSKTYLELHGILENAKGRNSSAKDTNKENKSGRVDPSEEWPSESSEEESDSDQSYDEEKVVDEAPEKSQQQSFLQSFVSNTDEYEQQQILKDNELRFVEPFFIPKIGDDLRKLQELREQERKQKDEDLVLPNKDQNANSASKFFLSNQEEDKNNFGLGGESRFGRSTLRQDNFLGQNMNSLGQPRQEFVGSDASLWRVYQQRNSDDALEQEQRVLQRHNEINAVILQPQKARQMFDSLWQRKMLNENI